MNDISVVVPVYNEENAVLESISTLVETLKSSVGTFELIVVNDGSTDKTREILENAELDIHLIHHDINQGYGAALKTGIQQSQYEWIVITDADGTYPHEKISDIVEQTASYDMVVGARITKDSKIPLIRRPAKWALNKLANFLCEYKIPDLNSGLRVMKKSIVMKFFNILPEGFSFTTTITLAMLVNGYRVKYVPIDYFKRTGSSKIRPIRDTMNFIHLIIRTVLYFRPLKIFVPISFFLFLASLSVLLYSFFFTPQIMDITTIVLFLAAIQMLSIGMIADLIDKRLK